MSIETTFIIVWVSAISLYASFYLITLHRHWQKICLDLNTHKIPALDRHRKTIGRHHGLTRNTSFVRTADFVNLQSVSEDADLNLRFYLAMPSFLVGLGVLGTFIGFSMTLWSIDNILSNADPTAGMKQLFTSVKAAFLTSVAGMFWSLMFSKYEKFVFNNLEQKIQSLCVRWDTQYYKSHDEYIRDIMFSLSTNLETRLKDSIESGFKAIAGNIEILLKAPTDALRNQAQSLKEQLSAWEKSMHESTRQVKTLLDGVEDRMKSGIDASFRTIATNLTDLLKAPTEALADQSDSLKSQLKNWETSLYRQIQTLQTATNNIKSILDQIDHRIVLINDHIQSIDIEAQAHSQKWTDAFKAQANALQQQAQSADNIRDSLAGIPAMFSQFDGILDALNNMVHPLSRAEAALTQGAHNLSTSVNTINQWAPATLQQLNGNTQNLRQVVDALEQTIVRENTELRASINDLKPVIDSLINDFDDSIEERLRRTNKLLEAYFKEIDKIATSIMRVYTSPTKP